MSSISFDEIASSLVSQGAREFSGEFRSHASVALILRQGTAGLEVLFIRRAEHEEDPWSGDLGFPGGKVEEVDPTERDAAERETLEEIRVDLSEARFLGRLDDLKGAFIPVRVSCFVYGLSSVVTPVLSGEVRELHWVPLDRLLQKRNHKLVSFEWQGKELTQPVIDLLGPGYPPLWGLTYRLIIQFLRRLGYRHPLRS